MGIKAVTYRAVVRFEYDNKCRELSVLLGTQLVLNKWSPLLPRLVGQVVRGGLACCPRLEPPEFVNKEVKAGFSVQHL